MYIGLCKIVANNLESEFSASCYEYDETDNIIKNNLSKREVGSVFNNNKNYGY